MIFGCLQIKKHRILFNIINNSIIFFPRYCIYFEAFLFSVLIIIIKKIEIIPIVTYQDVFHNQILKRGSTKKIDDFLKTIKKTLKKRQLVNILKQKLSIDKLKTKTIFTSTLNYSGEEKLLILILKAKISIFATKKVDVVIINANIYCISCKFKKAQVFTIFIKDLEYQAEKKARSKTNLKSVILEKYHNLLNVFSKKESDTFSLYQKYDYKTILEEKQKHNYAPLYKRLL